MPLLVAGNKKSGFGGQLVRQIFLLSYGPILAIKAQFQQELSAASLAAIKPTNKFSPAASVATGCPCCVALQVLQY